jgi:E3 ubiquitin-protein ligase TRIP12
MSNQQQQNLDETLQDSPHVPGLEYEEEEGEDHADEESHYDNGHGEEENEDDDDDEVGDEGDEEEMMNELNRVRRALGLQMEGLFGSMPSDSSRFRSILSSLKNQEEPTLQLIALQELAEILSVSNEDNLIGYFSCDSFVKELIRIMSGPEIMADMDDDMMLALAMSEGLSAGNPEIMLLACRCISNLLDAMPTAATSIVFHGGIKVLCQKLKSIQYIDLAEQALCVSATVHK